MTIMIQMTHTSYYLDIFPQTYYHLAALSYAE